MDWIFDNFQLVIAAVILVGYVLRAVLSNRAEDSDDPQPDHSRGTTTSDPGEEERTRQIQEEIRRRILARQRGEEPRPSVRQPERPAQVELRRHAEPATVPPPLKPAGGRADPLSDSASQAILERQRRLAEQMKLLRRSREASPGRSSSRKARLEVKKPAGPEPVAFGKLRVDLRRPGSLRRAVVLREILGKPLAMEASPLDLPRR